tara:strand:- start:1423 stop:2409 length:987 start_codon:yes stop_codon:yes gene_type:complete
MIIKNFEINKIGLNKYNLFLLYGDNQGFKDEITKKICDEKGLKGILYYEKEILSNLENFYNSISIKSFFENEKIIIIKEATDKLKDIIENIFIKKNEGTTIILHSGLLEKKSKLRNFFEKTKEVICIPFYPDEHKDLNKIAQEFFKSKDIRISQQTINLILDRANKSRQHLKSELEKIDIFAINKKNIKDTDIFKLTNLGKNYDIAELVETCLTKNQNKLKRIMNENHFSNEDVIMILRIFLIKTKRLLNLSINNKTIKNVDETLTKYKPPIFWKEKPFIKEQLRFWSESKLKKLIEEINQIELLTKKNIENSQNLLFDFIYKTLKAD